MAQDSITYDFLTEMSAILNGKRPPSERKMENLRAMFLEGYIKFAEVFAQSELGNMEIDIAKLALYIYSPEFNLQVAYQVKSIDDIYKLIEDDILNGMPIWRFFKCSEKTMQVLENAFNHEVEVEVKQYLCKQCQYLKEKFHDLGHYCVCTNRQREYKLGRGYHDYREITDCEFFKRIEK